MFAGAKRVSAWARITKRVTLLIVTIDACSRVECPWNLKASKHALLFLGLHCELVEIILTF